MKTSVTFLLDRSGSMAAIKADTIGGFNTYLQTLKQDAEDIFFTFLTFDSQSVDKIHVNMPVADAQELSDANFQPRGSTPLIDAAYKTIKAVEKSLNGSPAKVVICIQTDGEENASTEYTMAELNALIKEKHDLGWQFNFMGASVDAYAQAQQMGIPQMRAMSYMSMDAGATQSAFQAAASNARLYASGSSQNTNFSEAQCNAAGDQFAALYRGQKIQPVAGGTGAANPGATPASSGPAEKPEIVSDITL
jgi:uncharacterized protein YegL